MEIRIKPGLRRVWRESGSLQIGLSRRRGTVISGLGPPEVRLLRELEAGRGADPPESARGRELVELLREAEVLAPSSGGPPEALDPQVAERAEADRRVWSVVHGGLDDGWSVLAARSTYRVLLCGSGRVARLLGRTLREAGVGRVVAAGTIAAGLREAGSGEELDVAVLVEHGVADAEAADRLVSGDVPHLSVVVREDDVVVGPLVRPGRGPCLRCLDLYRAERDPAWPSILAQLTGPGVSVAPGPEETAVSQVAAGLAALQVLTFLDGVEEPVAAGATLEVELPHGLVAHRTWPAHPCCGCHWPPGPASERSATRARRMVW